METPEQYVKSVIEVVLMSLLLTLNIFQHCDSVYILKFERVNTVWDTLILLINLIAT